MNKLSAPVPVVSAILLRKERGETQVFLQTRWKPKTSPTYSGMIEIPAGAIDSYENIYDTLRREVKEETNLDIVTVIDDYRGDIITPGEKDKTFVFKPFICQQVLETNNGLPWIGFVFVCEARGEVKINESEARHPQWISIEKLEALLREKPKSIFPLQLPALIYFVEKFTDY